MNRKLTISLTCTNVQATRLEELIDEFYDGQGGAFNASEVEELIGSLVRMALFASLRGTSKFYYTIEKV